MLKGVLYFKLENFTARVLGPFFRRTGQRVYHRGVSLQGVLGHEDRLVPSLRCIPISDAKFPRLLDVRYFELILRLIGSLLMLPLLGMLH